MAKANDKIIDAICARESDIGRVVGDSLKDLREAIGLTQQELALRLGVGQASISKIEHRADVQISTLERYIDALGGELRLGASFDLKNNAIYRILPEFCAGDDNQLLLPIFGDERLSESRDIVLSIHPSYSKKIMDGQKTIELRRRFPVSTSSGTLAYIYSTTPDCAIVGCAQIRDVAKLPVKTIWKQYASRAFINKGDFDAYFSGVTEGVALEFINPRRFTRPIELDELRRRCDFRPPQSFFYVKPDLRKALQDECSSVSY